jgi:hypothetical protein
MAQSVGFSSLNTKTVGWVDVGTHEEGGDLLDFLKKNRKRQTKSSFRQVTSSAEAIQYLSGSCSAFFKIIGPMGHGYQKTHYFKKIFKSINLA